MGKTVLTSRQFNFLEHVCREEEIRQWYYLTGGTALSEFYLQHRLSEDIDLFTTSEVNDRETDKIIHRFIKTEKALDFEKRRISGLFTYKIRFTDSVLKIDFNNYPFNTVETGLVYKGLKIDSFYDIAINKAQSVTGRFQTRGFIDLDFILKKNEFSLEQLIGRVEDKFNSKIDRFYLASQFLRVMDLPKAYPNMLVPFDFNDMIEFFKKEAKKMGKKSLRK